MFGGDGKGKGSGVVIVIIIIIVLVCVCCICSSSSSSVMAYFSSATATEESSTDDATNSGDGSDGDESTTDEGTGDSGAVLEEIKPGDVPKPPDDKSKNDKAVVILYSKENYKGDKKSLKPGKYSFDKKSDYSELDNRVDSIVVGSGYMVYLYKDTSFKDGIGKSTKNIPKLGKNSNKLSSIIIAPK